MTTSDRNRERERTTNELVGRLSYWIEDVLPRAKTLSAHRDAAERMLELLREYREGLSRKEAEKP